MQKGATLCELRQATCSPLAV